MSWHRDPNFPFSFAPGALLLLNNLAQTTSQTARIAQSNSLLQAYLFASLIASKALTGDVAKTNP